MKKLSLIIIMLIMGFIVKSQVTYTVNSIPYAPDPYNGGTNLGLTADDIYSDKIPIGFTFNFFGNNYDSLVVSTNGGVSFNLSNATLYSGWATSGNFLPYSSLDFNNAILSPFQDLNPATSTSGYHIYADLKGVAPYRRLVISYDSVSLFSCTSITFSNQVILYETTNYIDVNIKDKPLCSSWNGGVAHLGIQNATGTAAYFPANRNGTQWTTSQESWRFIPSNAGPANTATCKVKGNIFFDMNSNCVKDASEYANMNRYVLTNTGNYYAYTDANGNYEMLVGTGSNSVIHNPYGNVSVICPSTNSYAINFLNAGDSISNIDFADSTQICSDLYSSIGVSNLRYCHENYVTVPYGNTGSIIENNAVLTIQIPANTYASNFSISPTSQVGNTYTFNLGNVLPGQMSYLTFKDSVICDTLLIGTSMCFNSSITGSNLDCDASNNIDTSCFVVVSSYDPNSIQAAVSHIPLAPYVTNGQYISDEWISYKIDFQNTGTASALNIRVQNLIDATLLDTNTVEMTGASHLCTMVKNNNNLNFYFSGINLLDSTTNEVLSHGWVTYKVKTKNAIPANTTLNNTANIFFDNNPVVTTNTCSLINYVPESVTEKEIISLQLFPNPMTESTILKLSSGNLNGDVILMNSLGQIVFSKNVRAENLTLKKMNLPIGVYNIKYSSVNGTNYFSKLFIK